MAISKEAFVKLFEQLNLSYTPSRETDRSRATLETPMTDINVFDDNLPRNCVFLQHLRDLFEDSLRKSVKEGHSLAKKSHLFVLLRLINSLLKKFLAEIAAREEYFPTNRDPAHRSPLTETYADNLKRVQEELLSEHFEFVNKSFDYLFKFYGFEFPEVQQSDNYYDEFVGEAILSLCMIYGKEWREVFENDKRNLLTVEMFVMRCNVIPVNRDGYFFFNYLFRIALIFEMAMFSFENYHDYFQLAKKCAYLFVDFLFFRDEGNWPCLKNAASVISIITRPLRFAVVCPKKDTRSFSDVVKRVEGYANSGVLNMREKEIDLLKNLNNQFVESKKKNLRPGNQKTVPKKSDSMQTLMIHFTECLPKDNEVSLTVSEKDSQYFSISLESWTTDTSNLRISLEQYKIANEPADSAITASRRVLAKFKLQLMNGVMDTIREERIRKRGVYTDLPKASASEPKRRKNPEKPYGKYFHLDKTHVENFVKLYADVLPSFLRQYSQRYLAPAYNSVVKRGNDVFILHEKYYQQRQNMISQLHSSKRIWGGRVLDDDYLKGIVETNSPQVLPITLQVLLDQYIKKNMKEPLPGFEQPILSVPKVIDPVGSGPIWRILGTLNKCGTSLHVGLRSMKELKDLQESVEKTPYSRTALKVDLDESKVQKFRFRSRFETKFSLPLCVHPTSSGIPEEMEGASQGRKLESISDTCSNESQSATKTDYTNEAQKDMVKAFPGTGQTLRETASSQNQLIEAETVGSYSGCEKRKRRKKKKKKEEFKKKVSTISIFILNWTFYLIYIYTLVFIYTHL